MNRYHEVVFNKSCFALLGAALAVSGVLLLPGEGMAQNFTLSDGGSAATLNLGAGSGGTGNIGMNSWTWGASLRAN